MEQKRCISSLTLAELSAELKALGQPGFRAKQIFHWVHQKLVTEFSAMTVTCVFAKQLLEPILCGQLSLAPLLPKLRGHFAEFLNNASSAGLRILSSSTCVGLRYGYLKNNSGFS